MKRLDANIDYLKREGKLFFHISESVRDDVVCDFTIEVHTPLDSRDTCTVRLDMKFINEYKLGNFDEPQRLECDFGVKDLKVLVAFPEILQILTSTDGEELKISTVFYELEQAGLTKGEHVDETYNKLKYEFDRTSEPSWEQYRDMH